MIHYLLTKNFKQLKVDWGETKVAQTPFFLPPLFGGSRLIVYGILPKGSKEELKVTLNAKCGSETFTYSVLLNTQNIQKTDVIRALAAKSFIRDLEEGRSYRHNVEGNLKVGTQETLKKEIIDLSVKNCILSKYTAFVAIEKRSEAIEGQMKIRKLAVDLSELQPTSKYSVGGSFGGRGGNFMARGGRGGPVRKASAIAPPSAISSFSSSPRNRLMKKKSKAPEESSQKFDIRADTSGMIQDAMDMDEEESSSEDEKMEVVQESMQMKRESHSLEKNKERKKERSSAEEMNFKAQRSSASAPIKEPTISAPKSDANLMREIIKKQSSNGSFTWDAIVS